MLSTMRNKFGPIVVGGIVFAIAVVFIFFVPGFDSKYGVSGAFAGKVNGEPIPMGEFNRELERRMEFFKSLNMDQEQLNKNFHIKDQVFYSLVNRRLLIQEAMRRNMLPSEDAIKETIMQMPAFQNEGQFDVMRYKQLLEANRYSVAGFEQSIRENLLLQQWQEFFGNLVRVSEEEIKKEFLLTSDKRVIKYVLITREVGQKSVKVLDVDIQNFMKDPAKLNFAKSRFESEKDTKFKGKVFDQVKTDIVRDLLASEKTEEIWKYNDKISSDVLKTLSDGKVSDNSVNNLLKPYGITVSITTPLTRRDKFINGVGEVAELMADAFSDKSPINIKNGGKPKKYNLVRGSLVAWVADIERQDISSLDNKVRAKLVSEIYQFKQKSLFESWMKDLIQKAKIIKNEALFGSEAS